MLYFETDQIELKEKLNDKLVRELVAFLNAEGGKIYIGVNNSGKVVGVSNLDDALKKISDIITDQIEPSASDCIKPNVEIEEGKFLITITVQKGFKPLYCIKKYGYSSIGCPIRIGTTCKEMTDEQISAKYKQRFLNNDTLVESFTNLPALSFHTLKQFYLDKGYKLNDDTFETNLSLISPTGQYNKMGELLSDNNRFSLIFVKFRGLNKATLSQRTDFGKRSLLFGYEQLMNRIASENICISDTKSRPRKDIYLFDYESVNEAIINAIAHNDWMVSEPQISFYADRLEILSHGGLPSGLTKEEFYRGVSKPRNQKLMKILSDLDIVEHTGHGVPTIIDAYGKEVFDISDNYIMVTIPFNSEVVKEIGIQNNPSSINSDNSLDSLDQDLLEIILKNPKILQKDIAAEAGISLRTVERHLALLTNSGYLLRQGSKKNGQWKVLK